MELQSKGEIDHVGGIAKNTIHWEVAKGKSFFSAENIVHLLRTKFGDNTGYGSCDLFKEYVLNKKVVKKASPWSDVVEEKAKHSVSITDLIVSGTICAIAVDAKSSDALVCKIRQ